MAESRLIWWTVALGSMAVCSGFPQVTLTDFSVSSYTTFINKVRAALPCEQGDKDGIKLLRKTPPKNEQFVLINLQAGPTPVTFALRSTDVYVIGYQVGARAWFFKDTTPAERASLFGSSEKKVLSIESNYNDLSKQGGDREKVPVSVRQLQDAASFIAASPYGPDLKRRVSYLVVVIEMVAEAARFKFIEKEVNTNSVDGHRPSSQMIQYERTWNSKVRDAILDAAPGHVDPKLKKDVYLIKQRTRTDLAAIHQVRAMRLQLFSAYV